jgi:hypothetical protein
MTYQLWDVASSNLIDEFDAEAEALDTARAYLTPDEDGVTMEVALVVYDMDDRPERSIYGEDLHELVFWPSAGGPQLPA